MIEGERVLRGLERLCPQTWWQWAIYGVMAALLVLNIALANMQALDASPRAHIHHSRTTPDADTRAGSSVHEMQPVTTSR